MTKADRYAAVGVKLDTAEEAKRRIAELVRGTRTPLARGAVGGFGGMLRVPDGSEPSAHTPTDGVGRGARRRR
jgi:phosphoribosylformylglycinamidine cyclo-ligase